VVLLLAAADPVTAQKEYERQLGAPGFASSQEAGAAEDLLAAVQSMNPDEVKKVVDKNVFNYLDNAVARIAKGLPNAILSGSVVGAAHAGEVATKGVTHSTSSAASSGLPAGWKVIGGGGDGYGGGASGPVLGSTDVSSSIAGSAVAAKAAARQAEADASARSALFSRPAAGAPASREDDSYSAPVQKAPAPAPAHAGAGGAGHEGEEDDGGFDFDKAIGDLEIHAAGEGGNPFGEDDASHHDAFGAAGAEDSASGKKPAAPAPAPAPAPAAGGEDDLGLF
jgi:hypothetical protein